MEHPTIIPITPSTTNIPIWASTPTNLTTPINLPQWIQYNTITPINSNNNIYHPTNSSANNNILLKNIEEEDNSDRRPWTKEEDIQVQELVLKYGTKKWSLIGTCLEGRTGKQCRERWHNHLNPDIKKDIWAPEEDDLIIDSHKKHGSRWSEISKALPGRTDNSIKNRWYSMMRRVSRQQGSQNKRGGGYINEPNDDMDDNNKLFRYCVALVDAEKAKNAENKDTPQNIGASIASIFASPALPAPKLNDEEKLNKKRKKKEEKLESVAVELLSSPLNSPGKLKRKNKKMHDEVEIEEKSEKPPKPEKIPKVKVEKGKPGRKRKQSEHDALKALASVASQRNSPLGSSNFEIEDSKTPFSRYKKKKLTLNLDDELHVGADSRMLDAMSSPDTNTDPLFSPPNNTHSNMSFYNHGNNIGISSYHPSGELDHRQILASPMSTIPLLPITPTPSSHSRFMMHSSNHRMSPTSVVQKRRYDEGNLLSSPSAMLTSRNEDFRNSMLPPAPLTSGVTHISNVKQQHGGQLGHFVLPQLFNFEVDAFSPDLASPSPFGRPLSLSPSHKNATALPTASSTAGNQALAQALALSHSISHPSRPAMSPLASYDFSNSSNIRMSPSVNTSRSGSPFGKR